MSALQQHKLFVFYLKWEGAMDRLHVMISSQSILLHIFQRMLYYYRPQRSCGQGYIFTSVCHSVHKGGLPHCMLGYPPAKETPPGDPPAKETPLPRRPPRQGDPPCQGDPPAKETPLPRRPPREADSGIRPVRILLECILVFQISLNRT